MMQPVVVTEVRVVDHIPKEDVDRLPRPSPRPAGLRKFRLDHASDFDELLAELGPILHSERLQVDRCQTLPTAGPTPPSAFSPKGQRPTANLATPPLDHAIEGRCCIAA